MRHVRMLASVASLALVLGACGGGSSDDGGTAGGGNAGAAGNAGSGGAGGSAGTDGGAGSGGTAGGAGSGGSAGTDGGAGNGGSAGTDGGAGSGGGGDSGVDSDGDGYTSDVDCDDTNPDVHPGATETCNGVDDNCDGTVDEGVKQTFYKDADQDGFGVDAAQTNLQGCVAPNDYSATAGDCDDSNPSVNPGATEACNDVDDNCDGTKDEGVTKTTYYPDADGDGYGVDTGAQQTCTPPSGAFATVNGDCDDGDKARFPGNPEVCDGKDNDCDAATPDPGATDWFKDADGDGFGDPNQKQSACAQPSGYVANSQDCNDGDKDVNPSAIEICDGKDNNCVGGVDEGPIATYPDADGDTYGDAKAQPTYRCAADATHVADNTDCDDGNKNINPGATEIPGNGVDENCDGGDGAIGNQCTPDGFGASTLPYNMATLLSSTDNQAGNPRGAGFYWDEYEIASQAGKPFTILMSASKLHGIDPHLYATANSCSFASSVSNASWYSYHPVAANHRSRILVTNPAAGYYDVVATEDAVATGSYVVSAVPGLLGTTCGSDDSGIWPLGWRQSGSLSSNDAETNAPIPAGSYADDYEVWFDANHTYTVLYSSTFSPRVALSSGASCSKLISAGTTGINNGGARLVYSPTAAGIYTVWATSNTAGQTGSYNLNVVPGNVGDSCFQGSGDVAGTGDAAVFWPISGSTGTGLGIGDRVDKWLGNRYFDDFETWLEAGESVTITMTASGFTPRLLLTSASFCTAALVNVDPASGNTATLTYTATTSGIYTLVATSHATSAAGNYTLSGKYN